MTSHRVNEAMFLITLSHKFMEKKTIFFDILTGKWLAVRRP